MRTLAIFSIVVLFSVKPLPADAQQNRSSQFGQLNNGANGQTQPFSGGIGQNQQGGGGANPSGFGNRSGQQGGAGQGAQGNRQHQGLVGRDAEDVRQNARNFSSGDRRRATFDLIVENLNEMRESRRRWRSQQRQPSPVRIQLRPAFRFTPLSSTTVRSELQQRLDTLPVSDETATGSTPINSTATVRPQIEMNDRTATLRGTVSSEHQRALLARLVSLEPGVSNVENLLTVETP